MKYLQLQYLAYIMDKFKEGIKYERLPYRYTTLPFDTPRNSIVLKKTLTIFYRIYLK